jgi:3-oxoadipate enol-lactonase
MTRSAQGGPVVHWVASGDGDPLLLVNGWTASGLVWPTSWLAELEERYRVIRPDNRGGGWSRSAPRPFTVRDMADDVRAVLGAAGESRARVMGLSMGGMIAQELAMRHPEVVSRLVLAGTRPPIPAATMLADSSLLATALRPPKKDQSLVDYFLGLWSGFAAPGFAAANPEVMAELVEQVVRRPTRRDGVYAQVRAMMAWHGAHRLRRLDVPTVVVHGAEDPLIPVANAVAIAELIPGARLELLDGVGHLVPHEAGDVLLKALDG